MDSRKGVRIESMEKPHTTEAPCSHGLELQGRTAVAACPLQRTRSGGDPDGAVRNQSSVAGCLGLWSGSKESHRVFPSESARPKTTPRLLGQPVTSAQMRMVQRSTH